jgi:hypothetical protein
MIIVIGHDSNRLKNFLKMGNSTYSAPKAPQLYNVFYKIFPGNMRTELQRVNLS